MSHKTNLAFIAFILMLSSSALADVAVDAKQAFSKRLIPELTPYLHTCPVIKKLSRQKKYFDSQHFLHLKIPSEVDRSQFQAYFDKLILKTQKKWLAFAVVDEDCTYQYGGYDRVYRVAAGGVVTDYDLGYRDLRWVSSKTPSSTHFLDYVGEGQVLLLMDYFSDPTAYYGFPSYYAYDTYNRIIEVNATGSQRPKFLLKEDLGSGGYSRVKRAIVLDTQKQLALRIIEEGEEDTSSVISQFQSICGSHANCVESGMLLPQGFGEVKFMTDPSLGKWGTYIVSWSEIGKGVPLPQYKALKTSFLKKFNFPKNSRELEAYVSRFYEALDIIKVFSEAGFCHGDLKIENLLIVGDKLFATDFGSVTPFGDHDQPTTYYTPEKFADDFFPNNFDAFSYEICNETSDAYHLAVSFLMELAPVKNYSAQVEAYSNSSFVDCLHQKMLKNAREWIKKQGVYGRTLTKVEKFLRDIDGILQVDPSLRNLP